MSRNLMDLGVEIAETTRPGPLAEWNDRIGVVATFLGLQLRMIDWSGSPLNVAFRVLVEAKNNGVADRVPQALTDYRASLEEAKP